MNDLFVLEAWRRLKALPVLKAVGISGFMMLFFVGYFETLNHPIFQVRIMAAGPLDRWIGYQPGMVWLYCTLWVYVVIPPALIAERAALIRYGGAAAIMAAIGLAVFVLWPTAVAREGEGFLKAVDRGGNACPSLHAAYAVFSAVCLERMLGVIRAPRIVRAANWIWCGGILYSALATKQHVSTDLVAGSVLGALAAPFALRRLDLGWRL